MNPDRREFLNLRILPARVVAEEAAWYLGFAAHDIPFLTGAGLLKPLGHPPQSGIKYFAVATLQQLRDDPNWLARASDAVVRHWKMRNALQRENHGRRFQVIIPSDANCSHGAKRPSISKA
jgi:hypothetical protein